MLVEACSRRGGGLNVWYSLGLRVNPDGTVVDVRYGGVGDRAKLAPSEKILAVDGKVFSADGMREAIREAKSTTVPIQLLVQQQDNVLTIPVDYHEGEKYPMLQRVDGTPDYLDDITKPRTTSREAATQPAPLPPQK